MPPSNLRSAVEALLFSSDQPLPLALLADSLDSPLEQVTEVLQSLGDEYRTRDAGIEVREMAGGWIVTTTSDQHEWVGRMLRGRRKMRLSRPALETLAIIAYKQPVTKSEIEAIRGVDSSGTLATLLDRTLVTIKGRSTVVGRPLLYGSTPDFLNYFGLKDLTELPRPEELRALVAAREPEQMEMLDLDADGLPLALLQTSGSSLIEGVRVSEDDGATGGEDELEVATPVAHAVSEGGGALGDDGADMAAALVSGDSPAASDDDPADEDDEDEDEDEFEDDDEDEEEDDDEEAEDDDDFVEEDDEKPSATLSEQDPR
jgi:segregation and condensation protein B